MSEKPKRRFWQIHLSTVLLSMLVMGVILLLSFAPRESRAFTDSFKADRVQGWPIEAQICIVQKIPYVVIVNPIKSFGAGYDYGRIQYHKWPSNSAILMWVIPDLIVAVFVASIFAFICELYIRRREGRKP
jgi:hypothetical protein